MYVYMGSYTTQWLLYHDFLQSNLAHIIAIASDFPGNLQDVWQLPLI